MDHQKLGRFSFIGSDPFLILKSQSEQVEIVSQQGKEMLRGNPFDILGNLLEKYKLETDKLPVPFIGGAVGYFSYDLCHFIERLPYKAEDDLQLPECYLAFYDAIVAFDHLTQKVYIISTGFPETDRKKRESRAYARLTQVSNILNQTFDLITCPLHAGRLAGVELRVNFTHKGYIDAVHKAKEYIKAGDIFEVNLSQRFCTELNILPYELYNRLRTINPAPFACYLDCDEVTIVSASPERFIRLSGDLVETRPIKGTRPRGSTEKEDIFNANELMNSAKDRAEHIMIVDLERNDLGRVCRYGTVNVRELMVLEKYATVFQLVSTVEGKLQQDKNCIDLLKATFPGGSITGAPKVRSMEIIDELEPTRRSIYTGNIGYLSFNGEIDLNIAIRTFLVKHKKAYFQVGGAVTYDSDPELEYEETLDKAKALFMAMDMVPEIARQVG